MLWIFLAVFLISIIYIWVVRRYSYWTKRGIDQNSIFENVMDHLNTVFKRITLADIVLKMYNFHSNERYFGGYQFLKPVLVLRDPDLIKQLTVKDFDFFVNHSTFIPDDMDPLWSKNLFSLKNEKWRDMRSTLSPAFTGSKMKYMFTLISESSEQFSRYFLEQNKEIITVKMKDVCTRFTNDVIANTAFGVKCDSLKERDNEFYVMGKDATDFGGIWKNIKFMLILLQPRIMRLFGFKFFPRNVDSFFRRIVKENLEMRRQNGIVRPDMIHLLLQAQKNGGSLALNEDGTEAEEARKTRKQEITDEDITAQALLFFFGGFDSVSSLMCFFAYEVAVNPDIQEKLIEEVDKTLEECNGKLSYEALMKMKYLDMVVSETLRKWPNAPAVDRQCNKSFTIEPLNSTEKPFVLDKDTLIWIPIFALHRNPKFFPEPDRFDPERFNDENKNNIKPYTYLPFGSGPRNCIGSRFALLETKLLFFHILKNFKIVPVEETQIPFKLSKTSMNLMAEDGFILGLKKRNK